MDPVSAAFALKAGSALSGGLAGFANSRAQKKQAEINSFIGRTRAIQTSVDAAKNLNEELGSMRNVMAANQQAPGVGTFEIMQELRDTRDRERRIGVNNRRSEAAGYRNQASAAGRAGVFSLLGGAVKAGPSLFDLYQYNRSG